MSDPDSGGKEAPPPYDEAIHMRGSKESEGDVEAAELAATASAVAAQAVAAAIARTASLGAMAGADNGDGGCAASKADVAPASTEPSRVAGAGAGSGAGAGGASEAQGDGASEGKAADEHPVVALTRSCKALRKFVKLVVWDFDLTVLSIHSFGSRIEPHHVPHRNLGVDFVDLPMFQALVRYLVDEAGIGVAIASFGSYPTIKSYLDLAFPAPDANGAPFFTRENTSTPESVGYRDGCSVPDGKLPQLFDLIERYGCRREEVLFFDDDRRNADSAARSGFLSFHVSREGFCQALWALALKDLERLEDE